MSMTKPLSVQLHNLLVSEFSNSSDNLRKFACSKKYKELKNHYRVYKDEGDNLHLGFFSDNGLFYGRAIIHLACGNKTTYAYHLGVKNDVTKWFIEEYKQKGMCAYTDMRHEWPDGYGYDYDLPDGTTRTCIHCGHAETLNSKMVRKTWWE